MYNSRENKYDMFVICCVLFGNSPLQCTVFNGQFPSCLPQLNPSATSSGALTGFRWSSLRDLAAFTRDMGVPTFLTGDLTPSHPHAPHTQVQPGLSATPRDDLEGVHPSGHLRSPQV